jgi:threonine dehydratase
VQLPAEQVSRTAADGLRTQSIGDINFEHIRRYVDEIITVSEEEIEDTMLRLAENSRTIAEPSGAVSVAGFLFHKGELPASKISVAVISGGNIAPESLARVQSAVRSTGRSLQ